MKRFGMLGIALSAALLLDAGTISAANYGLAARLAEAMGQQTRTTSGTNDAFALSDGGNQLVVTGPGPTYRTTIDREVGSLQAIPVVGVVNSGERFNGTLTITRFGVKDGAIRAFGVVTPGAESSSSTMWTETSNPLNPSSWYAFGAPEWNEWTEVSNPLNPASSYFYDEPAQIRLSATPVTGGIVSRALAQRVSVPVTVTRATCNSVSLSLGNVEVAGAASGLMVQRVTLSTSDGSNQEAVSNILCNLAAAGANDSQRNQRLVKPLNQLIGLS